MAGHITHAYGSNKRSDKEQHNRTLICASSNGTPEQLAGYLRSKLPDDLQIILKTADNAEELAQCAPFTNDYPVPESGAVYYLCENGACKAPVSDFEKLNL